MRVTYSVLYIVFLVLLILCAAFARRSSKPIGRSVAFLEATLVPPVLGNLLIISSTERITSIIGCYVYFIGVDLALYSLVNFTNNYCQGISKGGTHKPTFMYYMLAADAVQLALNPFSDTHLMSSRLNLTEKYILLLYRISDRRYTV